MWSLLIAAFFVFQDPQPEPPPQEPIVISATRTQVKMSDLPFALEYLSYEQIQAEDMDTLTEVLRGSAGLHVVNNGTRGYNVSVFTRGTDSSHTLVLIDGFKLNRDGDTFFEMEMLSPHDLARAEILRGPGSSLYGSGALGGVIHLETVQGAGEPRFLGSISLGSFATHKEEVLTTGKSDAVAFTVSGYRLEQSDGQFDNSDVEMFGAAARLDVDISPTVSAKVVARGYRADRGIYTNDAGPLLQPIDLNAWAKEEMTLFGAEFSIQPAKRWLVQVRASTYVMDRLSFDGGDAFDIFGDSQFDTFYDRFTTEALAVFEAAEGIRFSAGVERTEEDFTSDFGGGFGNRGDRDNTGGFLQAEASVLEELLLTLSGRVDDNTFFGSEATWRAAAAYRVRSSDTKLRCSWGTGITAPAFLDLLGAFGNPKLLPEEAQGGDVGIDQAFLGGSVRVSATAFYNSIQNLIQGFPPANVGRARTRGVELGGEYAPGKEGWFARGGYTLLRAKDEATGLDLIRRPRHEARLGAGYRQAGFGGWVDVVYVGEREDINFATFARETVDGFFKVDLSGRVEVADEVRLTLRVENAFDSNYEEVRGFPGAEFNAMLGLEVGPR